MIILLWKIMVYYASSSFGIPSTVFRVIRVNF
jgi:hypothetical protein